MGHCHTNYKMPFLITTINTVHYRLWPVNGADKYFIVAPLMLGLFCPPRVPLDSSERILLKSGLMFFYQDDMWVVFSLSTVDENCLLVLVGRT